MMGIFCQVKNAQKRKKKFLTSLPSDCIIERGSIKMINPNPKIDLTTKQLSKDRIENLILNNERKAEMLELSRKRAEFLTTCTEKEFNDYKKLRKR